MSEIHPLHTRSAGTALGTMVNFLMTFVIGQFWLGLMCRCRAYVFLFFAGWLLLMGAFTALLVPETKGVPIEAVEEQLFKRHWFWGRVMAKTYAREADAEARGAAEAAAAAAATIGDDPASAAGRDSTDTVRVTLERDGGGAAAKKPSL